MNASDYLGSFEQFVGQNDRMPPPVRSCVKSRWIFEQRNGLA